MTIEQELKTEKFQSEQMKAQLNILFTANWLNSRISSQLKPFQLSSEQFNVLRILRGQNGRAICQKEILARMLDRNSNLTLIIRKLTDKNLITVKRSAEDKREYRIVILPKGLEVLSQLDVLLAKPENNLACLTPSEANYLNDLLNKIRES
jgi:DNA-binding MarR family transcriptional regulator